MIVAGGSAAFAGAGLAWRSARYLARDPRALVLGGAAWLLILSTFNVTVQLRTPRWVVGRAMAIYQAGVFGGLALGGWLWGVVAEHYGVPTSLIAASLALAVTALLGRILPMPTTDQDQRGAGPGRPGRRERPALPRSGQRPGGGEHRVPDRSPRRPCLPRRCRRLRRMRRRNGARRWALLHDAADPEVWIERFETPTWLDHLRVRDRMTVADREVDARILAFHGGEGPPVTRYLLAHVPNAAAVGHGADPNDKRSMVYDPSLPPALTAKPS